MLPNHISLTIRIEYIFFYILILSTPNGYFCLQCFIVYVWSSIYSIRCAVTSIFPHICSIPVFKVNSFCFFFLFFTVLNLSVSTHTHTHNTTLLSADYSTVKFLLLVSFGSLIFSYYRLFVFRFFSRVVVHSFFIAWHLFRYLSSALFSITFFFCLLCIGVKFRETISFVLMTLSIQLFELTTKTERENKPNDCVSCFNNTIYRFVCTQKVGFHWNLFSIRHYLALQIRIILNFSDCTKTFTFEKP